jgi:putative transposase
MKPKTRHLIIVSLLYWALRRLLELIVLALRSEDAKEIEIVVLRHQLQVLRRQVARRDLASHDRAFLAAASRVLPRTRWRSFFVRPETILSWHRKLIARRGTYPRRAGRPPKTAEVRRTVVRLAKENPTWVSAHPGRAQAPGDLGRAEHRVGDPAAGVASIPRRGGRV